MVRVHLSTRPSCGGDSDQPSREPPWAPITPVLAEGHTRCPPLPADPRHLSFGHLAFLQVCVRLPRTLVESPSLKGFTRCVDVALGTWVSSGPGSAGDSVVSEGFSTLNDYWFDERCQFWHNLLLLRSAAATAPEWSQGSSSHSVCWALGLSSQLKDMAGNAFFCNKVIKCWELKANLTSSSGNPC